MINLFFILHDYSGVNTYANQLLRNLSRQQDVSIYKVNLESKKYKEYTEIINEKISIIHVPAVNNNNSRKYASRCLDLMEHLINRKKNVLFHLNNPSHRILGIEAQKRFSVKIVFTLHYLPLTRSLNRVVIPEKTKVIYDYIAKDIAKTADHVICVTQFAKEVLYEHFGISLKKMTVVYNGFSFRDTINDKLNKKIALKNELGFTKNDRIVLFVGRLQQDKGVGKLIEAFNLISSEFPYLNLVLIGSGEYGKYIEQSRDNVGRIHFSGQLSHSQVVKFYQIADIGVIPSEYEQCSYVALEMMKNKLPIVSSNVSGLRELFEERGAAVLVSLVDGTSDTLGIESTGMELHSAIKVLVQDKKYAKKIANIAFDIWKEKYTAQIMCNETMKVYKETMLIGTDNR